jgi:hypothetical protein
LNKTSFQEEGIAPQKSWSKTEAAYESKRGGADLRKTTKTFNRTFTDLTKSLLKSYNRKFYSNSTSLQKPKCKTSLQTLPAEAAIFAKKFQPSQKPKLVTVGNLDAS